MKLKDIYDSNIFHGRLTEGEVYDLCRAELTNHGKPEVYIWFLHESDGKLQGRIYGYRPNETVPFIRHNDVQQVFLSSQTPGCNVFVVQHYNHGTLLQRVNGSSGFCKGPRTSKVWKSKDPKGPQTFRLYSNVCTNQVTLYGWSSRKPCHLDTH